MKIYGHRGSSATHPENTLDAFAEAIRLGAEGVELDVHASSDGVPVVVHDRSLARTMGSDINVDETPFEEIRRRAPAVPTLAEVFELVGSALHVDLEVKQAGIERHVLDLISNHPNLRWAVSCFDWNVIRAFRALAPQADLWLLGMAWDDTMATAATETGASAVALYNPAVTRAVVEAVHGRGLQVMVWTVNDVERGRALAAWGVDMVCTDAPGEFIGAI